MKKSATVIATVVALLVTACTAPEPVVEQVEVTRLVDRTVEIDVTVPVTRIVEQTVEVQVTVPVTQVVEKTVEVTREVTREIPVTVLVTPALPSATATATATPAPTATPSATATPAPTATPSISLAETTRANLWAYFTNDGDHLAVLADPAFDVNEFGLSLFVDGKEYCNSSRIYGDEGGQEMSCEYETRRHTTVRQVSAQTPMGDLRCERNDASGSQETVFACAWRN